VPLSDFKLGAIERNSTNPTARCSSLDRRVEWNSIKSDGSCGSPDQIALTQARVDDKVDSEEYSAAVAATAGTAAAAGPGRTDD
jgi:hypothetical protein